MEMTKLTWASVLKWANDLNFELLEALARNGTNFKIVQTGYKKPCDVFGDGLFGWAEGAVNVKS